MSFLFLPVHKLISIFKRKPSRPKLDIYSYSCHADADPKLRDGKRRLRTFHDKNWDQAASPIELAEAGFIAINSRDAQCVWCGIILTDWNAEDIPIREHMENSPNCCFTNGWDVKNIPLRRDPFRGHPNLPGLDVIDG